MLHLEIYKLFKRKLVWIILVALFSYALYYDINISFDEDSHMPYELEKYEAAKGILTDERLGEFIENYQPAKYDAVKDRLMDENGKARKVEELFPDIGFDLHFGYFGGWGWHLSRLQDFIQYIFAFVILAFSATFTYEKECNMQEILFSTKNGRQAYTNAKVVAAFLITNLLCLLMLTMMVIPLFLKTKGVGWDTSIQMITWLSTSTLDMNNLELLFHTVFMSFLAINVILLITLTTSFLAKNPVAVMCVSLGILFFFAPDAMAVHVNNNIVNFITSLTPLNVIDVMNLTEQTPIQLGGIKIPCLTIAEVTYTLLLIAGGVFFLRVLTKHQRYYAS